MPSRAAPQFADIYVGLRDAGRDLAIERRGVDPARASLLPIALPSIARSRRVGADAKVQLGWPPSSVVLLSIARAPKFRLFNGEHYSSVFLEILSRHEDAMLVVVGPEPDEAWQQASMATDGRIVVFAERPDTSTFYEAADIYVDSFPFVSNTSLLEAGSHSLPLVSRCPVPGRHTVVCADAPGFADHIDRKDNRADFVTAIEALIQDPARRESIGEATRNSITAMHVGHGWQIELEKIYGKTINATSERFEQAETRRTSFGRDRSDLGPTSGRRCRPTRDPLLVCKGTACVPAPAVVVHDLRSPTQVPTEVARSRMGGRNVERRSRSAEKSG